MDAEVEATSAAQAYSFSSPWGSPTITRRRFLQTVALGVYHIEGGEPRPGGPEIAVKLRLRLDADAGMLAEEPPTRATSDRFVPGLQLAPLDIMYGYVEGRNLAKGWLGFGSGGSTSPMRSVVGVRRRPGADHHAAYFADRGYGGSSSAADSPCRRRASSRTASGAAIARGSHPGSIRSSSQRPLAPAYGVGARERRRHLDSRAARLPQGAKPGDACVSPFPNPVTGGYDVFNGTRTSSERIGYAMDVSAMKLGGVKGGMVYDLFDTRSRTTTATSTCTLGQRLTVGVDYDYFRPTFDGDSIFNYFTHSPLTTITGRLAVEASDAVDFAASAAAFASSPPKATRDTWTTPRSDGPTPTPDDVVHHRHSRQLRRALPLREPAWSACAG